MKKIIHTKDSLSIGKYTIIDGYEYETYKYEDAIQQKKISTATLKNLKMLEKCGKNVIFDNVYLVDKSKGRNVISTYISGTIDGKDFIWARIETRSAAAGQTLIYFDTRKLQGSVFIHNNYTPEVTISEGLYKVNNEYRQEITYYKDSALTIKRRIKGPAYARVNSKGNIELEHWYSNNILHRIDGPAYTSYRTTFKQWIINGVNICYKSQDGEVERNL